MAVFVIKLYVTGFVIKFPALSPGPTEGLPLGLEDDDPDSDGL